MPAALPGSTPVQNAANPSAGLAVIFDALSGPKGSPLDARKIASWSGGSPVYAGDVTNLSTGALQTGIGFGSPPIIGDESPFAEGNFSDNYTLGLTKPDGLPDNFSTLVYIGGGRSAADGTPDLYTAGFEPCMAGNGGSRDGGAGPAFTGFPIKTVTATATVANGAAVEAGWTNRSGKSITAGQSVFGSSTTPNSAAA